MSILPNPDSGAGTQQTARPARAAVFIDKNGTLMEDVPNNVAPERIVFSPSALEGVRQLAQQGLAIVVVTSEPGLGLGLFNRAALSNVENAIAARLRDAAGVNLAGFYTCPHKPGVRGEPACLCRMPAPGLLRQAALSLRIDLAKSWMIGDMLNHVEAGRRVGARTVLVESGRETNARMSPLRTPHFRAADLVEASEIIASAARIPGGLALEIDVTGRESRPSPRPASGVSLRTGPLRGFEPHPTREWL